MFNKCHKRISQLLPCLQCEHILYTKSTHIIWKFQFFFGIKYRDHFQNHLYTFKQLNSTFSIIFPLFSQILSLILPDFRQNENRITSVSPRLDFTSSLVLKCLLLFLESPHRISLLSEKSLIKWGNFKINVALVSAFCSFRKHYRNEQITSLWSIKSCDNNMILVWCSHKVAMLQRHW